MLYSSSGTCSLVWMHGVLENNCSVVTLPRAPSLCGRGTEGRKDDAWTPIDNRHLVVIDFCRRGVLNLTLTRAGPDGSQTTLVMYKTEVGSQLAAWLCTLSTTLSITLQPATGVRHPISGHNNYSGRHWPVLSCLVTLLVDVDPVGLWFID